jgi:hypothetical protein
VSLPGNGTCSVAGTFDGTYYTTTFNASQGTGCTSTTLGIYTPPVGGNGAATLTSTKAVVDSISNLPVRMSAVDWDSSRNMMWAVDGSTSGRAYLVDLGDKTVSGTAPATLQFTYSISGFSLIDGLTWDFFDDTIWISPDVDCNVFHFSPTGTPLGSIQPKNSSGQADC